MRIYPIENIWAFIEGSEKWMKSWLYLHITIMWE
jgi:hypothetical protein